MTEAVQFRRFEKFRAWGALVLLLSSCASGGQRAAASSSGASDVQAELSAQEVANGSIVLVTVKLPEKLASHVTADSVTAGFEGATIPFFPVGKDASTYEAVLGIPLERATGETKVTVFVTDDSKETRTIELPFKVVDGKYPVEELHVNPKHVNPPKKAMVRIKREIAEVGKVYARLTREKLWTGPFVLPVQSAITSYFGSRRIYNGQPRAGHPGTDLRAPVGTPIHAPAPGVVAMAKNLYFTGNTVILDHGYGVFTLYAHMSKLKVKEGDRVEAGALLGLSGMTGRANGPHLHWGAIVHKVKVNPLDLTKVMR